MSDVLEELYPWVAPRTREQRREVLVTVLGLGGYASILAHYGRDVEQARRWEPLIKRM